MAIPQSWASIREAIWPHYSHDLRRLVDATLPRATARGYATLAQRIAQVLALAPGLASRACLGEIRTVYRTRRILLALLDAATASWLGVMVVFDV